MKKDAHGTIIGASRKAPHGYGECRACGHKNVHLTADGYLAKHGSTKLGGICPGSGDLPVHARRKPPGEEFYVPLTTEVYRVQFLEDGDGGYNLKRRPRDPVLVLIIDGTDKGEEMVVERDMLYTDPLAASVKSAQLYEEAMKD